MLIVLTLAGLILLIIFLAIPALERNSRNNQRKQDVATVLGAFSQYQLNNSGDFPKTQQDFIDKVLKNAKISHYDKANNDITIIPLDSGTNPGGNPTNTTNADQIIITNRSKCSTTANGQPTPTGAGFSDVVALFSIETSSGSSKQCQEL